MDLFVVPTIGFRMLYGFVIVRLDGRDLVWTGFCGSQKYTSILVANVKRR
jgi:hypothetical protein